LLTTKGEASLLAHLDQSSIPDACTSTACRQARKLSVKDIRRPGQCTNVLGVDERTMGKGDSSLWIRIVEEGPFGTFAVPFLPTLPTGQRRLAVARLPAVSKTGPKVAEIPTLV
jgi:hypothetical protein